MADDRASRQPTGVTGAHNCVAIVVVLVLSWPDLIRSVCVDENAGVHE